MLLPPAKYASVAVLRQICRIFAIKVVARRLKNKLNSSVAQFQLEFSLEDGDMLCMIACEYHT